MRNCAWEKFRVLETEYQVDLSGEINEFELILTYDDLKATLVKEFYIYDGIDMVMAVGGILAFFLGFSLLSVLLDCVDVVSRACGYRDDEVKFKTFKRTFRQ